MGAWPLQRLGYYSSVAQFFIWLLYSSKNCCLAKLFHCPGWQATLDTLVKCNGLKTFFIRISRLDSLHNFPCFISFALINMSNAIAPQDVLSMMNPHIGSAHLSCCRNRQWLSLRRWHVFNFLLVFLQCTEKTLGNNSSRESNTTDLGPQEVFLPLEEEWVRYDLSFQITCKTNFHLTSSLKIIRH